ncbi:MAG TPA: hypothetical protein PKD45_08635 [Flavobacteriales bacterium]|mgnify:CR=1 FL=1|nr:hypothetical protein [Flavobacteriales bacterium]
MADALLACGYILLFLYLIGKLRFFDAPGLDRRTIGALFLLKVVAGTALWWVYTYHYDDRANADIYKFFDDGNILFSALPAHPLDYLRMVTGIGDQAPHISREYYEVMNNWYRQFDTGYYNDAHTMIRFNALVRIFSFGVYHIHTVFASFLALIGLVALYKGLAPLVPGMGRAWAAALFLWPSALLWSSGPIKEAPLFLGWGLFLWQAFRWLQGSLTRRGVVVMALALLLQLGLKSYVLACMAPGLVALWWCRRTGNRLPALRFGVAYAGAIVLALLLPMLSPALDVVAIIQQKQRDMLGVVAAVSPGSFIPTDMMERGVAGLLNEIPHALYLAFLSPLATWDIGALGLMGAAENVLLLTLPLLAVAWRKPWAQVDRPMLFFCISFCLALGLLIGWTTPVVGAVMRYRVPMLPFLTLAVLLVIDPNKLEGRALFRKP